MNMRVHYFSTSWVFLHTPEAVYSFRGYAKPPNLDNGCFMLGCTERAIPMLLFHGTAAALVPSSQATFTHKLISILSPLCAQRGRSHTQVERSSTTRTKRHSHRSSALPQSS